MLATAKALIEATDALPEYRVLNVTALTLNNAVLISIRNWGMLLPGVMNI